MSDRYPMSAEVGFIHWCEAELESLRKQLEPLVSGQMKIGRRSLGSDWVDVTPEQIEQLKKSIAALVAVIARHQR
jgi:hypothetical protein